MNVYLSIALFWFAGLAAASDNAPIPEANDSTIGYKNVAEALVSLRAQQGLLEQVQEGWRIFQDNSNKTIWSFAPRDHSAYPSAVKRQIIEKSGTVYIRMSIQCEASKTACDQLVRDFENLNKQMTQYMASDAAKQGK